MKILIAGATGLLAKPVIEYFDKEGFELKLFSRSIESTTYEKKFDIVKGDVFNDEDLEKALDGCDAVHITLSKLDEPAAVSKILNTAKEKSIKLISYVSGSTVSEENRWFKMIDDKMKVEEMIIDSGIPYIFFRPTWFFESLKMMVRDGKAMMIGKQPIPWSWVAADDFGRMVAHAYSNDEALNKIFYIHGPEKHLMIDLLEKYAEHLKLEHTTVKPAAIGMLKFIAFVTGNTMLKFATKLFAYFEKTEELGDPTEANELLGKPTTTFEEWLDKQ